MYGSPDWRTDENGTLAPSEMSPQGRHSGTRPSRRSLRQRVLRDRHAHPNLPLADADDRGMAASSPPKAPRVSKKTAGRLAGAKRTPLTDIEAHLDSETEELTS